MIRKRYLYSYDISDDKRRTKVFNTLVGFGDHLQFSVFLCDLSDKEKVVLNGRLNELIHASEDQILAFDMGSTERELQLFLTTMGQSVQIATKIMVF